MFGKKKQILVVRQLGGLGDCLMMSCVYRGLKEKYPKSTINLLTGRVYLGGSLIELAERNPYIDNIHIMEPYDGTTKRTTEVWNKHYSACPIIDDTPFLKQADLVIDLNTACVEVEWHEMTTPENICTPRYKIWCDKAEVTPSTYFPVYVPTAKDKAFAEDYWRKKEWDGKTVIGVGIAACDSKRTISLSKAQTVCRLLKSQGYHPVTIDPTFQFAEYDSANGLRTSEIMAVVAKMNAVVTPDTGLLHMAGTMNVPVIGLFGPTDQAMRMGLYRGSAIDGTRLMPCAPCWYSYPCTQDKNIHNHFKCLKSIGEDVIVEEVRRWVENPNAIMPSNASQS